MKRLFALFLVFAFCSILHAQTAPPALMVQVKDKAQPLGLSKVETEVRIFGYVAETTTTMTFFNPMDRVMEGDLYFPLPEGATVSGYALDVEGKMVDGVAVEKHKGREVFEEIVRRGVDPGLIEWTKGNNFKTRVFPIPAQGTRTIRVDYVTELIGSQGEPSYHLPLNFKDKLGEFSLRVEVVKPAAEPEIQQGRLADLRFERWRDSFVAETKLRDVAITEDLIIALPDVQKQNVLVEKADDGQVYFAVHDFPEVPEAQQAAPPPKHIVIYWDASGSRAKSDHAREIGLVKAYLQGLARPASAAKRMIHVDVILLRHAQSKPKHFVVPAAQPDRILAELEKAQYDGGTQMGALTPKPGLPAPDFYMLFSDGISNFGAAEARGLDAPVYVFSADATADHAFLRHLAMSTGGRYFNLKRMPDAAVIPAIGRPAYCFLSAEATGGSVAETYPELPQPLAGRFTLVGKLDGKEAEVTLKYGYPGETTTDERSFAVSRDDAAEGSLLKRLWAQMKLADLMALEKRNEKEIVSLGKQHGLVTPFTSLLVLDSLDQYVEHEIAPPESLPEMREEYLRQVDTLEFQKRQEKADKLESVVEMWKARVEWWNTEFKYPKEFKYREEGTGIGGRPDTDDPFAPPAAAPRPAPPAEAPAEPRPGALVPSAAPTPQESESETVPLRMAPLESRMSLIVSATRDGEGEEQPLGASARQPGIVIKPWDPKTPYMTELKAAGKEKAFDVYMKNRAEYGTSPAFFLDCADHFFDQDDSESALQVLSNIAELELENAALFRVLGHRLGQKGYLDLAVLTFEEVLDLRPEEPQSYRDLALVLARRAEERAARAERGGARSDDARSSDASIRDDYARAIELLNQIVLGEWDERFTEIEVIALMELNRILPKAKAAGVKEIPVDERLIKLLDVDVRIVMTWHADNTDIDLWVTEPSGEKAYYAHNLTTIGGLVSQDFTGGYGPEEYLVRRAMPGMYKIEADYFGSQATRLLGAVTVQVDVLTNFGRETEARKSITLRLKDVEETATIGQIEF